MKKQIKEITCFLLVSIVILTGCPLESESIPETPIDVTAVVQTITSIRINWSWVSNADGYHIYRSDSEDGEYEKVGSEVLMSTQHISQDLTAHTTYFYKVSAYNSAGESSQSDHVSATTTLIANPTNVRAEAVSSSSIRIEWDAVPAASRGYRVYRSLSETGEFTQVTSATVTTTQTTYTNSNLDAETTYYYRVKAINFSAESEFSDIVSAATPMPRPATPSNVRITANSTSSITVTWNAVPNADEYRVYRHTSSIGTFPLIETTAEPSFTDEGLTASTSYYYRITAYNAGGESIQSSAVSARTHPEIPNAPLILSATANDLYIINSPYANALFSV